MAQARKKVYLMMSGGVDSSVAAFELLEEGCEVFGVYIKSWSAEQLEVWGFAKDDYGVCWESESEDAMLVAKSLGIPFEIWDFEKEYKSKVADYMVSEYQKGRTPNPDVMCNSMIKFGIFYEEAMKRGADFVATGHYARAITNCDLNTQDNVILRGEDSNKDQTYFLWKIKKEQLKHILFPIGKYQTKKALRDKALEIGLHVAKKPDSQGICFIGKTPLREILLKTIGKKKGEIIDENGKILGSHPGAHLYTIGQREKLGLAGGPWFVSRIDIEKNQVIVAHGDRQESLYSSELVADEMNWLVDLGDLEEVECEAQIRYRQEAVKCRVVIEDKNFVKVKFGEPVRAVAKGQSVVFYSGDVLLGGGVIC